MIRSSPKSIGAIHSEQINSLRNRRDFLKHQRKKISVLDKAFGHDFFFSKVFIVHSILRPVRNIYL